MGVGHDAHASRQGEGVAIGAMDVGDDAHSSRVVGHAERTRSPPHMHGVGGVGESLTGESLMGASLVGAGAGDWGGGGLVQEGGGGQGGETETVTGTVLDARSVAGEALEVRLSPNPAPSPGGPSAALQSTDIT